ncbi:hypothetical protein LJB92_04015 [Bacteroidales bacterium OttesenSCG-928-M06]|nr:hypothetical protein [Bacteroidales bacterium OttesenSCG-928-M06]
MLLTTCSTPCKNGHEYITFINNSSKDIICFEKWQGKIGLNDTLLECGAGLWQIKTNKIEKFKSLSACWEGDFVVLPFIQYFVLDAAQYDEYAGEASCDTIRKYIPILQRYQLTLEDLNQMNWIITYPPEK